MHREEYLSTRPTIVQDETGNSIQAMCVCERMDVDIVIARLAYYGVGNIVGSINVLNLEAAKFLARPTKSKEEQQLQVEVQLHVQVQVVL